MKKDRQIKFVLTRIWQYLSIYFIKPFDAINDTLTSSLIYDLNWDGEFIEIGAGDGMFSFVMHGGRFPLSFDRYLLADASKDDDIYDCHQKDILTTRKIPTYPVISCAVDRKMSHTRKISEINFAKVPVVSAYERLPFGDGTVDCIFLYTPHGLDDHADAIQEAGRILKSGGKLLFLAYDDRVKNNFVFHRLASLTRGKISQYFSKMDAGRHDEISSMSRSRDEWRKMFAELGFEIVQKRDGLSSIAWKFYDVQTRPFLRILIQVFQRTPEKIRKLVKLLWMLVWFPGLIVFYFIFSRQYIRFPGDYSCYLAYQLVKKG